MGGVVKHPNKYLGTLCKRGHDYNGTGMSLRYNKKRRCVICHRERAKKSRENDPDYKEKQKVRSLKHRKNNPNYEKERYWKNPEKAKKSARKSYKKHSKKRIEYQKKYRKDPKNIIRINKRLKKYNKKWRKDPKNKEKIKLMNKKENVIKNKLKWLKNNPEKRKKAIRISNIKTYLFGKSIKTENPEIQKLIDHAINLKIQSIDLKQLNREIENESSKRFC